MNLQLTKEELLTFSLTDFCGFLFLAEARLPTAVSEALFMVS